MKSLRFVSLSSIIFAVVLVVATRFNPVVQADQPTTPGEGQKLTVGVAQQQAPAKQKPAVSFAKAVTYDSGGLTAYSVAVGDLNGDGRPDLVVANYYQNNGGSNGGVSVLLGNGDGTFQPPVSYSSGAVDADSIAIGDVNGDGHPDLVVTNYVQCYNNCYNGVVSVLLGNGDGAFQPAVSYNSGAFYATAVAIGDVNGDGHPDLVISHECSGSGCSYGAVTVLLGNGDGTFQSPAVFLSGGSRAVSIAIGDLNSDGHPDLVVVAQSGTGDSEVSVLLGNGDGTFQSPVSYYAGGRYGYSVAVADLNGDGHPDVVVANECLASGCKHGEVSVLLGNGDGTLQAPVSYASHGIASDAVAVADVNGDGNLDLVLATACNFGCELGGGASVLLGNGDGTFQAAVGFGSGADYSDAVAISDVNGDGRPDLMVVNCGVGYCGTDGSVGVLLNNFTVATSTTLTSSPNPSQINQSVTFTAKITSTRPIPDGQSVNFYNGRIGIGTAATANGVATLTTSFPKAITYTIRATYTGGGFLGSSSGIVKQVVNP